MQNQILSTYVKLVPFLGTVLGSDYEIVLHKVGKSNHEVIAIANADISGRHSGSPLTDLALDFITSKTYETQDSYCNYKGISKTGKILRSSTFFIKDNKEKLIGMLCINYDTSKYTKIIDEIASLINFTTLSDETMANTESMEETFVESVNDLVLGTLQEYILKNNLTFETLTPQCKIEIVEILKNKGIFQIKGAVVEVSKNLNCSIPTIYRYLNELKI